MNHRRYMHTPSLIIFFALILSGIAHGGRLTKPYVNPDYLTKVTFGVHSHWAQPWRAYLETVPASRFIDSIGINFDIRMDKGENPDLIAHMLAKYGIRHARIEISWGNVSFDDELIHNDGLKRCILACKKYSIRPLILLNAHHGAPCPIQFFERILASPAKKGDTKVELADVGGLVPGYSGLNSLTDYIACEAIITGIEGNTVTLSKPLPADLGDVGKRVPMATLKYRPFSPPDSEDYRKTIAGWQKYTETAARFVTDVLGTAKNSDKGFDIEIWNELSFGSSFLSINNYYTPSPYKYNQDTVWANIVKATVDCVNAHPSDFKGVALCDGFSNTIPWPASSTEPARVSALSHHPYAGIKNYPADEYKGGKLDALLNADNSAFIPTYTAVFPEYYAAALQTETGIRDMAPIETDIYGTKHGRNARVVDGKVVPCSMWITEVGTAPNEIGITDIDAGLKLKAKTTARYLCFHVNKGVDRLYLYAACAEDKWLGIVKDDFVSYARTNTVYPADDSKYISPSLQVIKRITDKIQERIDPKLVKTRQLRLDSISDTHDHSQFQGDGTPAHPNLYDRDVFAFLPFQVNSKRFVIPYYVMTRDIRKDLAPEEFTVQVSGINGKKAAVSAYDPINNRQVLVKVVIRSVDKLKLTLMAADYPYLLIVQE
ncbi:MAG: hypothetical protein ACYC0V_08250 [Armatimonadota bacterium]